MSALVLITAGVMLAALVIYACTGGADFGGGMWDLVARGPRAAAQRDAIAHAIAPVWEANHVWLIFVIVVMFTAFPPGFARIGTELHVPLTIMLIGIVMRGSAFVFRQYGAEADHARWGRVFAISSVVSPALLGCSLGAMSTGHAWYAPVPLAMAALALVAFAFLAAVYLVVETEGELAADFRRRVRGAGIALGGIAAAVAGLAWVGAPRFAHGLVGSPWSVPVIGGALVALGATLVLSARQRDRAARAAAIATMVLLVAGWAGAQYPYLVAPDLTLAAAAAPTATLEALLPVVLAGTVILLPSLWWLLRVFKSTRGAAE